jgi:two-component system cell cycle sensor histidine kinase/response regulator CckA
MSSEFVIGLSQAVMAVCAGGLTWVLARASRRALFRYWAVSWFALAVYALLRDVHTSEALRPAVLKRALHLVGDVAGTLEIGLLVAVAWSLAREADLPRRSLLAVLGSSVLVGALLAFSMGRGWTAPGDPIGAVGAHAVAAAVALPLTSVWLLVPLSRACVSRVALSAAFAIVGGVSATKIAIALGIVSRAPGFVTVELVGLADVTRYTALGLASALVLAEELRIKATRNEEAAARAVEARDRTESWFGTLVENARENVLVVDGTGRCLYASPSISTTARVSAADAVGVDLFTWIHPEDLAAVRHTFERLVSGASPAPIPAEFRVRKPDGSYFVAETTGVPLPLGGGTPTFMIIVRDVSMRRQAHDRERRLEQQLFRAQKSESLGRLAGGVAHDFNNLLTVIYGSLSLVRSALDLDHPVVPDLVQIEQATRRAGDLTRQLLAFSRRQVVEPRSLELDSLVRNLSKMLDRLVGETVQVETRLGARGVHVLGDAGQLEQVIVNLAVNARDAMPTGGHLLIETSVVEVSADQSAAEGLAAGAYVHLAVSDTGVGVPAEIRDVIFEPFFTTKAGHGGTGLGLSTCEGIVRQHGGRIWFDSPGRGTRFHVWLPASEQPVEQPGTITSRPAPAKSLRILLVEDEAAVRQVAYRVLVQSGHNVVDVGDPSAARAIAMAGAFDVLVTDVVMPGLSGAALARQIVAGKSGTKVLFISGYSPDIDEIELAGLRYRFLRKPFSAEELRDALDDLLMDPAHA